MRLQEKTSKFYKQAKSDIYDKSGRCDNASLSRRKCAEDVQGVRNDTSRTRGSHCFCVKEEM